MVNIFSIVNAVSSFLMMLTIPFLKHNLEDYLAAYSFKNITSLK